MYPKKSLTHYLSFLGFWWWRSTLSPKICLSWCRESRALLHQVGQWQLVHLPTCRSESLGYLSILYYYYYYYCYSDKQPPSVSAQGLPGVALDSKPLSSVLWSLPSLWKRKLRLGVDHWDQIEDRESYEATRRGADVISVFQAGITSKLTVAKIARMEAKKKVPSPFW